MESVHGTEERMTTVGNGPPAGGSLAETYVLRLWEPPETAGREPGALRGVVRHVRSGRTSPFVDGASLLAFLRAERHAPARSSGGAP
jgi:hypothetical protein